MQNNGRLGCFWWFVAIILHTLGVQEYHIRSGKGYWYIAPITTFIWSLTNGDTLALPSSSLNKEPGGDPGRKYQSFEVSGSRNHTFTGLGDQKL